MLNEQLQSQIEQEAETLYDLLNEKAQEIDSYDFGLPMYNRQTQPIVDCLTQYAEKWQAAEQWKTEASLLLDPLLEWGQAQKDMPLGISITAEILRRAKLWQGAEEKVERYEKALKEICGQSGQLIPAKLDMIGIASEALTHKTSDDE